MTRKTVPIIKATRTDLERQDPPGFVTRPEDGEFERTRIAYRIGGGSCTNKYPDLYHKDFLLWQKDKSKADRLWGVVDEIFARPFRDASGEFTTHLRFSPFIVESIEKKRFSAEGILWLEEVEGDKEFYKLPKGFYLTKGLPGADIKWQH
tara:strand:+ start:105 stop:554 length:450 start_codon:yes stop_codon:yes gene_type:complete